MESIGGGIRERKKEDFTWEVLIFSTLEGLETEDRRRREEKVKQKHEGHVFVDFLQVGRCVRERFGKDLGSQKCGFCMGGPKLFDFGGFVEGRSKAEGVLGRRGSIYGAI